MDLGQVNICFRSDSRAQGRQRPLPFLYQRDGPLIDSIRSPLIVVLVLREHVLDAKCGKEKGFVCYGKWL